MKKMFVILIVLTLILASLATSSQAADNNETNLELSKRLVAEAVESIKMLCGQSPFQTLNRDIPTRPDNLDQLSEMQTAYYYDHEYAGEHVEKINPAVSPGDGCNGKRVIMIQQGDHASLTAYNEMLTTCLNAMGMDVRIQSPNWDINIQNQLIDQAINAQPDAIILCAIDAVASIQQFRKINQAGIPVFATITPPDNEAFAYMTSYAGLEDYSAHGQLAMMIGELSGGEGGIVYMSHVPGNSAYISRYQFIQAVLAENFPNIKTLQGLTPDFDAAVSKQIISDLLNRFRDELKIIMAADGSTHAIGAIEALQEAGRDDVLVFATGNCQVSGENIKAGYQAAETFQSLDLCAGVTAKIVADFFNGEEMKPVNAVYQTIITKENIDEFLPSSW